MKEVTILYYTDSDLRLYDEIMTLEVSQTGRVIIPDSFKKDKQVIAVIDGGCKLLNRLGERVLPFLSETGENKRLA